MDPKATFERFMEACNSHDWLEADEAYYDLRRWLEIGGAMPQIEQIDFVRLLFSHREHREYCQVLKQKL